jgi:tetratricopeptide (TPR) repeat protein
MKRRFAIVFFSFNTLTVAFGDPRVAMREGFEAFERGAFAAAAAAFERAEQEAESLRLDPSVPRFNKGVALYRQQLWDAAAATFLEARMTPNLDRQARALYNAACCRLRQVDAAIEMGDGRMLEQHLDEAIEWLGQSLLIRPDRDDARRQLERALAMKQTLALYLSELNMLAQRADRLIAEHRFEEAHTLLASARERLSPALILQRPEVKTFEQTLERTGQIVQILRAEETPAPTP